MTHYTTRYATLDGQFQQGIDCRLEDAPVDIRFFRFTSTCDNGNKMKSELIPDYQIAENFSFEYPVFLPAGARRFENCILLLHGLNERSWSKYLP